MCPTLSGDVHVRLVGVDEVQPGAVGPQQPVGLAVVQQQFLSNLLLRQELLRRL